MLIALKATPFDITDKKISGIILDGVDTSVKYQPPILDIGLAISVLDCIIALSFSS
jgi:hypothetical protein